MLMKVFCLILCLSLPITAQKFSRTITVDYNPGFPKNCTNQGLHLVYAKAVSESNNSDVLHYVVTAGKVGPPTIMLIASKGTGAQLVFNCSKILSNHIDERRTGIELISGAKVFTAGFLVTRLWQFNDTKDAANMSTANQSDSNWFKYSMNEFVWTINSKKDIIRTKTILLTTNATVKDQLLDPSDDEELEMDSFAANDSTTTTPAPTPTPTPGPSHRGDLFRRGGSVELSIFLSGPETRRDAQPRLYFTGNSSQLDVSLKQLSSAFTGARFGLTFVHVSSLKHDDAVMRVDESRSIDDEFTPGIFKMLDWKSYPKSKSAFEMHDRAFLQWKPICYTSAERSLSASQQMFYYAPLLMNNSFDQQMVEDSVVFPWFNPNSKTRNKFEALRLNISFGQPQDGFYLKSNYTEWSSSMGLGDPPSDSVSLLVILIIAVGLGLPFILIVAGFVTVLIRRQRAASEGSSAVYPVIN